MYLFDIFGFEVRFERMKRKSKRSKTGMETENKLRRNVGPKKKAVEVR